MACSKEPDTFSIGKYQLEIDEIGKGAFGIVYKGTESDSGAAIAAKKIRYKEREHPINDVLYKMGNTELQIIRRLQEHKNIIRLIDYQDDGRCHWIIMEFCDRGDLIDYFKNSQLDFNIKLKVIYECASAIAFMHGFEPPIVHRDIKPQNVLMKRENNEDVAKITDFGIGKLYDDKRKSQLTMTTAGGTSSFMAPEFFDIPGGYLKYQPGIDTFALGLLFHVILTYEEDSKDMIPLSKESRETGKHMAFGFEMVNSSNLNHPPPVLSKGIIEEEEMPEVKQLKSIIHQMIAYRVQDRMPLIKVKDTVLEIYRNSLHDCNSLSSDQEKEALEFCREHGISKEILEKLESDGITMRQDILDLSETDMKELGLNMGERKKLLRAINNSSSGGSGNSLHGSNSLSSDQEKEALEFCREHGISKEILEKLESDGITMRQDILDLSETDMKELGLNMGERKKLLRAINNSSSGGTDSLPEKVSNLHVSSSPEGATAKIVDADQTKGWIQNKLMAMDLPERLHRFAQAMFGESETNFEPEEEEVIGNLNIKRCKLKEVYRNKKSRIRKCVAGKISPSLIQKTLIMVGATGSGKSTLIDGIANYMFAVSWDQNYRLKLVSMTKEEKENAKKGQSASQTDWITIYSIPPGHETETDYVLNIVDTPGFADTRGIGRDEELVDQIRNFMCNPKPHGIDMVNGICFVAPAPNARLTSLQKYVFNAILSMFGKDVQDNIFVMATFADGDVPPVIASLDEAKIQYKTYFPFNNSALFAPTTNSSNPFTKMFWELGMNSYKTFLMNLKNTSPTSLTLSADVLRKREMLSNCLDFIQIDIQIGCQKLNRLAEEEKIMKKHEDDIKANRNFKYVVRQECLVKSPGTQAVNCSNCKVTCHPNCIVKFDVLVYMCCAMNWGGNCTVCKARCSWRDHYYEDFKYVLRTKRTRKTYFDMKRRYDKAKDNASSKTNVLTSLKKEIDQVEKEILDYIITAQECLNELQKIALKQDPLSSEQYIDLLIYDERRSLCDGWEERVKMLENIKERAKLTTMVQSSTNVKDIIRGKGTYV